MIYLNGERTGYFEHDFVQAMADMTSVIGPYPPANISIMEGLDPMTQTNIAAFRMQRLMAWDDHEPARGKIDIWRRRVPTPEGYRSKKWVVNFNNKHQVKQLVQTYLFIDELRSLGKYDLVPAILDRMTTKKLGEEEQNFSISMYKIVGRSHND